MKKAIICDIDGTLAIMGNRGPYEFEKAFEDYLNLPVFHILQHLTLSCEIFIVSGRDSIWREMTEKWLLKYKVPYRELHMRPKGDNRKDCVVKREIYENHISGKYEVLFVLDDRDQVVKMWREELKLSCFQVNYGNF